METIKKVLITGSQGFIAKNLIATLSFYPHFHLLLIDRNHSQEDLDIAVSQADFIFHLAGVNRPINIEEFQEGNVDFTARLLASMERFQSRATCIVSSSKQAEKENPYGLSKKQGESLIQRYVKVHGNPLFLYRFTNVFGKWSKPNYNSVVATFCHQIARNQPIQIHDESALIELIYIDDIIDDFLHILSGHKVEVDDYLMIQPSYLVTLKDLANYLYSFKENRLQLKLAELSNPFVKKLLATYLSYLDEDDFAYSLKMHQDHRGSFTEILKLATEGQVSVNISKPGITKGNHYHHTKHEKFIVVSGKAAIRFRKVNEAKVIEYIVDGNNIQVVDIPPGYTHHIENIGNTELVTVMWVSEWFDPHKPDTYPLEVIV